MDRESPWLQFYEPHAPAHLDYLRTTLPILLRETARERPNHPAMVFKGTAISYRAFDEVAGRLAAALRGLGKGERVKVHVVLKEGETATEEEIITFCREQLALYKIPKFVEFRTELPKTLVGKVLRRALQEM
ncbi:MAG TPA: hypothetical protein G4O00_00750 [Thermoflexia bacterium]|jgi:acyl-CoA synthetase (AMP-forming)/AMP-acid ligase II|nr:hypothetical protein [Thermoflexia bacterium]